MADTLPNISLPANVWVDLYAATGITVGTRLLVQNLGSSVIKLTTSADEPTTDLDRFADLHWDTNNAMANDFGDLGAWAYSENNEGLLNVAVFPS